MPDTNFTFRVDVGLKDEFLTAAQAENRNASLLLRDFIRQYVREHQDLQANGTPKKARKKTKRIAASVS